MRKLRKSILFTPSTFTNTVQYLEYNFLTEISDHESCKKNICRIQSFISEILLIDLYKIMGEITLDINLKVVKIGTGR